MPYARKSRYAKKSTYRKSRYTKKKGYRRGRKSKYTKVYSARQTRLPTVVPDRSYMKFKYATLYAGVINAGSTGHVVLRGNSLFNPDTRANSTQPFGFSQWSAFYNKYCVHGAKIKVTAVNLTANKSIQVVVIPDDVLSMQYIDITTQGTRPYARKRMIASTTGMDKGTVTNYISTRKVFGVHKAAILADEDYSSNVGENPTKLWYWHVYFDASDLSAQFNIELRMEITYYAELYSRKTYNVIAVPDDPDTYEGVKVEDEL